MFHDIAMSLDDKLGKFDDERSAFLNRLVEREEGIYFMPKLGGGYYNTVFTEGERERIVLASLKDSDIVGAIADYYTHITEQGNYHEVIEADLSQIKLVGIRKQRATDSILHILRAFLRKKPKTS